VAMYLLQKDRVASLLAAIYERRAWKKIREFFEDG